MLFNSIPFLLFFVITILLYYVIPSRFRYIWLLICSYLFYFSQSTSFVALLLLSTVSTYIAGIMLSRCSDDARLSKNLIVASTFLINAGILVFIKYCDFTLELAGSSRRFNLFLPIGISFYTLQALSYVMDCYRKKMPPVYNFFRYALFVSFFPSLLSGPINRARDLMPELACDRKLDLDNVKFGMMKMLWGYFLKCVIAARLTILVDTAYANADGFSGASLLVAAISFLFMLYCDFEGYSSIAIGAARILGITMRENFAQPFYSVSMGELWRRWHISLSTWLREYLYYPLGGSRKGTARRYFNMLIVFLVSGLWHGANFTFIIWGILNGMFLIVGNILMEPRQRLAERTGFAKYSRTRNVLRRIGVYALYGFSMIFFASDSVSNAMTVIRRIFTKFDLPSVFRGEVFALGLGVVNLLICVVLAVFVLVVDGYCHKHECDITGLVKGLPTWVRWVAYLGIVTLIVFSANLTGQEFIYATM